MSSRLFRHRLTGWNAVKSRVEQLKLEMTDEQIKDATNKIKELADVKTQTMEDVDVILRVYHKAVTAGVLEVGDGEKLDELLDAHRCVLLENLPLLLSECGLTRHSLLSLARFCREQSEEPAAKRIKTA